MTAVATSHDLVLPTLYFDDLVAGMEFVSPGRTVTESDIVAFAGLSGDFNPLHVDSEFAKNSPHGERIAHGLLVLSILSGLSTRIPFMAAIGDAIIGLAGLECRWKRPTHIGDTLHVHMTVAELAPTSKGTSGIVTLVRNAINQNGEVVLETRWKLLLKRRRPDGAS